MSEKCKLGQAVEDYLKVIGEILNDYGLPPMDSDDWDILGCDEYNYFDFAREAISKREADDCDSYQELQEFYCKDMQEKLRKRNAILKIVDEMEEFGVGIKELNREFRQ